MLLINKMETSLCVFPNITAPTPSALLVRAESCGWRSTAKTGARGWCFLNVFKTFILFSLCRLLNLHHIWGWGLGVVLWCSPFTLEVKTQSEMDVSIAVVSFVSPYPHTAAHYMIVCAWEHKNHICTGRLPTFSPQLSDLKSRLKGPVLVI